jgi:hypothetical protein
MSVIVSVDGTIDEQEVKKSGVLEGKGTVSIEVPNINTTSVTFDYKKEDQVTIRLKSAGTITLNTENTIKINGGIDYNFLNRTIGGNFGIEFVVSKRIAMDFGQTFGTNGNCSSAKFTINF